jgi:hypothetical protein
MGKGSVPKPNPAPVAPDPEADEMAKAAAAEAKSRQTRRAQAGSMNRTLATSPEGVLGAAPTSQPALKSQLG